MKKNQIVIVGVIVMILLLFFMLIYRSDGGLKNIGDSKITIKIEPNIKLSTSYSDSLLELVDLYISDSDEKNYSQSSLSVFKMDGSSIDIVAPISGINQFRSFFSSSFYTYTDRQEDITRLKSNVNQFSSSFINNCSLSNEVAIKIGCALDSSSGFYIPDFSVREIKEMVKRSLFNNMEKVVHIHFTTGESGGIPVIENNGEGGKGGANGPTREPGGPGGVINDPGSPVGDTPPVVNCKASDVATSISFTAGLPNIFTWTEQDGFTYDFSISCTQGDCSTGLSYRRENVSGGSIDIEASYEQATEKKYTATLTIKCNGKVLKSITKVVKLLCA